VCRLDPVSLLLQKFRQRIIAMPRLFRLAALLAITLAPLSALPASTVPDGGLLVTRVNSEQWELQLVGGSQARQFTGSLSSTEPVYASSARPQSSSVITSSELGLTLNAVAGGTDYLRFSVSLDAALCLRGSGAPIYIGGSLEDAVLATAPVALHGSDACSTAAASTTTAAALETLATADTLTTTTTTTTRKYNKGHYVVLMGYNDSTAMMAESKKPGVKGFMKRYMWKELEPTQGNYDFSEIQADLAWCAANGMQLVVMVEDKSFKGPSPAPAYLAKYAAPNVGGGYTMIRWNPTVVWRFKALLKALGRFDSNKAFEGVATQESAPSLPTATLTAWGYTPEKYRDAYINVLSAAGTAMPTSRVFWYMNFIPGNQTYIASIAQAVASKGVVMGGPDVAPDNYALQKRTYPYYDLLKGTLPMFGQVEGLCYEHLHATSGYSTKYWTMLELYKFARDHMHANYMFWVRIPSPSPADSYDYFDALPVIQAYPIIN
jgi:hypothetical protein